MRAVANRNARRLALALLACLWLGPGCGYTRVDLRGAFGPDVDRIRIRAFANATREVGVEQMLLDSLVEEFRRRDALRPVLGNEAPERSLVLDGAIRSVRVRPSAFSSSALGVEDTLEVVFDVRVRRAGSEEVVWERERFTLSETFLSSPDPNVWHSNKEQALRRLSALAAGRIHDELFRRF